MSTEDGSAAVVADEVEGERSLESSTSVCADSLDEERVREKSGGMKVVDNGTCGEFRDSLVLGCDSKVSDTAGVIIVFEEESRLAMSAVSVDV